MSVYIIHIFFLEHISRNSYSSKWQMLTRSPNTKWNADRCTGLLNHIPSCTSRNMLPPIHCTPDHTSCKQHFCYLRSSIEQYPKMPRLWAYVSLYSLSILYFIITFNGLLTSLVIHYPFQSLTYQCNEGLQKNRRYRHLTKRIRISYVTENQSIGLRNLRDCNVLFSKLETNTVPNLNVDTVLAAFQLN
jgi:hypothetical protein